MTKTKKEQTKQEDGISPKSINTADSDKIKVTYVMWRGGNKSKHTIESSRTPDDLLFDALNSVVEEAKAAAASVLMDTEVVGILLRTPEVKEKSALKVSIQGKVTDGNPVQPVTTRYLEPEIYGSDMLRELEGIIEQIEGYIREELDNRDALLVAA